LLQDYPLYTSLDKCRFSTCISVNSKPSKLADNISYMEIPPRTYVSFKVKGGITELIKFITRLNTFWIPQSGYEFAHFPAIIKPLDNPLTEHQHDINHQVYIAIQPK
jgi:DNA gyrase inhibitor GyrI